MSQPPKLSPRDEQPPRPALALFALLLIALTAAFYKGFEASDPTGKVAGNIANFSYPSEEKTRPEEPAEQAPPGQAPPEEAARESVARGQVTDLDVLLRGPADEGLAGRQVALEDVPVQSVVGNYTFWIGPGPESRVPVVLRGELMARQPEERVEVREGMRVRIFGVVRELRDVDVLDEARFLSAGEREALEQAEFFISAVRVVPLEP